jgi:hypothetical protein
MEQTIGPVCPLSPGGDPSGAFFSRRWRGCSQKRRGTRNPRRGDHSLRPFLPRSSLYTVTLVDCPVGVPDISVRLRQSRVVLDHAAGSVAGAGEGNGIECTENDSGH